MASRRQQNSQITRGSGPIDLSDPRLRRIATRNAVNVFNAHPDIARRSVDWYEQANTLAHRDRAKSGAPSVRHAEGILAAVSPGSEWDGNNDSFLRHVGKINRRDTDAIMRGDVSSLKGGPMSQVTGDNMRKALRIREGEDPDLVLGGVKTNNFYHNIDGSHVDAEHPRGRVTVDYHGYDVLLNSQNPTKWAGRHDISGNVHARLKDGSPNSGVRRYEAAADAMRDAAEVVNHNYGTHYEAHQFQSGLWVVAKHMVGGPGYPRRGQRYV